MFDYFKKTKVESKNFTQPLRAGAGFTILYAVITVAAVITIGVSITGIYQRQTLLVSSSEASSRAFYAADAALECALKWDNRDENEFADGASSIECAGDDSVSVDSCSGDCDYTFELDDFTGDANVCAEVVIDKQGTGSDNDQVIATSSDATDIYDISVGEDQYRVFEFENDGTFTVLQPGEVEYLVVAGGGAGGGRRSGGGGAGGMLTGETSVSGGDKAVDVGAGGSGNTYDGGAGSPGENSSFLEIEAIGGGGGAGNTEPATDGGSGGGGGRNFSPGSGTAGQGHDGGEAQCDGAGGGGAGEEGHDEGSCDTDDGDGGDGLPSDITDDSVYYAGGGGGDGDGAGGEGGGGDGANVNGEDGVDGLGGGGGGTSYQSGRGGDGGDGIVIIRYLLSGEDDDDPVPTQIEARGRNTCEPSSRQAERALRTAY